MQHEQETKRHGQINISPSISDGALPGHHTIQKAQVELQTSTTKTNQAHACRILKPTFSKSRHDSNLSSCTLGSAWMLWDDDIQSSPTISTDSSPPLLDTFTYRRMVGIFFEHRWPYLPVVHYQSFLGDHLDPFLAGITLSTFSNFMLHIVFALATVDELCPLPEAVSRQIHRQFFGAAVRDLDMIMAKDDLQSLQCVLLLCMYGHYHPQTVDMWYTSGLALRMATALDLHRRERILGVTLLDAEMAKRYFWCACVIDCSMAINLSKPLGIHASDITMPLPQLPDHQLGYDSYDYFYDVAASDSEVTSVSTFIHIVQLRKINAHVYQSLHASGCISPASTKLSMMRKHFHAKLNSWAMHAPQYLQHSSTFQSPEWFQIAFHHAILLLYRPCRAAPMLSPDDLQTCVDSAIGLISSYSCLFAKKRIKYTFIAMHSLFLAALVMLYALRNSSAIRQSLTKPVTEVNISTFCTLTQGIANGRRIGHKCSEIIQRLSRAILGLFDGVQPVADVDNEFASWFGISNTHLSEPSISSLFPQSCDAQANQ